MTSLNKASKFSKCKNSKCFEILSFFFNSDQKPNSARLIKYDFKTEINHLVFFDIVNLQSLFERQKLENSKNFGLHSAPRFGLSRTVVDITVLNDWILFRRYFYLWNAINVTETTFRTRNELNMTYNMFETWLLESLICSVSSSFVIDLKKSFFWAKMNLVV